MGDHVSICTFAQVSRGHQRPPKRSKTVHETMLLDLAVCLHKRLSDSCAAAGESGQLRVRHDRYVTKRYDA